MPLEALIRGAFFSLDYIHVIMTITTLFFAYFLVWAAGANGFVNQQMPRVVSTSALLRKEWDDLAPPFNRGQSSDDDCKDAWEDKQEDVTHFCFLVHGHRGYSKDLSYLQTVMQSLAEKQRIKCYNETGSIQDLVVHNCVCNEGKTNDGVENGGRRLVEELKTVLKKESKARNSKIVTVSFVGNSLGGLYSRYAIVELSQSDALDFKVHFNVFCTTATPHLGISRHTYLPLPRSAENMVAHALGDTGKDLFRLNDLMKSMATSEEYIAPLRSFRKRIAYANAYGTDFPVPAETAAFLSDQSTYPHHFSMEEQDNGDDSTVVVDESGLVIATLHTPPGQASSCLNEEHEDELVQMSTALDALGWTKIFIDIRKEVPRIAIPRRLSEGFRKGTSMLSKSSGDLLSSPSNNSEEDVTASIKELKQKKVVESRDVAKSVKLDADDQYHRLHLPVGHNMIVAFSRGRLSTFMNKGGRPVVDALAKELVEDIFSWKEEPTEDNTSRPSGVEASLS
jgi:hypothetical protein